jgi:hypothetical protein
MTAPLFRRVAMSDALVVEPYLLRQAQCIADAGTRLLSSCFLLLVWDAHVQHVVNDLAGKAFEDECSYPVGYVHQPVYACVTCHGPSSPFYGEVRVLNIHHCESLSVQVFENSIPPWSHSCSVRCISNRRGFATHVCFTVTSTMRYLVCLFVYLFVFLFVCSSVVLGGCLNAFNHCVRR